MRRTAAAFAAVLAVVVPAGCSSAADEAAAPSAGTSTTSGAASPSSRPPSAPPASTGTSAGAPARAASCTVAAAGDIAGPGDADPGAAATAALIAASRPVKVLALGDLAYEHGTPEDFRDFYAPTWGRLRGATEAVPGNHDVSRGDAGIVGELGASAVENRGVDVCGWRVVLVNEYAGVARAARFVTADAAAHPGVPTIVVWHEPRYSSGSEHGDDASLQPLWAAAVRAGARIVLNGHDHDYERFAPMDQAGGRSARGTREFVSGLGGHNIRGLDTPVANSERRFTGRPAVLFLNLQPDGGYSWSLRTVDGAQLDAGQA